METWNMNYKIIVCFLLISLLTAGVSAIPPLPYEFYGNVSINETPAEAGVVIIAKVNGTEVGNVTTAAAGTYGGSGTFDRRLVVNGAEDQIGEFITFWIGDKQAVQKVRLYAGESQKLDLTFIPGKEGSVDASVSPSQSGTLASVPSEEETPAATATETKAPLFIAPLAAGLALFILGRRV